MNTDKTILHLRPHHFLCIPNYRGHGYSSRFDEKMKAVIAQLQEGSGAEVRITQGVDDLCGACPHCTGSCCDSEMPALFDSRFLALTGLAAGDSVIWKLPGNASGESDYSMGAQASSGAGNSLEAEGSLEAGSSLRVEDSLGAESFLGANSSRIPAMSGELLEACCTGCSWKDLCMEIIADQPRLQLP